MGREKQKRGIWDNNTNGNVGDFLKKVLTAGADASVVSAYFTIFAFNALREQLENIERMRFLFGDPSFVLDPSKTDSMAFMIEERELRLRNRLQQRDTARRCHQWISDKVEVRSVQKADLLHGKMYHIRSLNENEDALIGSSNFTLNGLGLGNRKNIELNIELNDRRDIYDLKEWFDEIWESDITKDVKEEVLGYLEKLYNDISPEFLYYLTLYHVFDRFLRDKDKVDLLEEKTGFYDSKVWNQLYGFQKDGVRGAINKILQYNGCIVADSVGLGKTFEALAVIKYFELLNYRVLVLTPKRLRENWSLWKLNDKRNFLAGDRFRYDVLNHTDLTRESGKSGDIDLGSINWGNYDLLVIDESHNFRNNAYGKADENGVHRPTRYERLMEEVVRAGIPTKVLLLSATPVNNTLRDLRNQIYLITQNQDDALGDLDIGHIGNALKLAQNRFRNWSRRSVDERKVQTLLEGLDSGFFKLLDALTIARSRRHIKDYYDLADVGAFPERMKPSSESPDLDLDNRFPSYDTLNHEIGEYRLSLFHPSEYVRDEHLHEYEIPTDLEPAKFDDQRRRERFLIGMMKVNFLKRLESSIHSFEITLDRTITRIEATITKIQEFEVNRTEYSRMDIFDENIDDQDDEELQALKEQLQVGSKIKYSLFHLDLSRWRDDLKSDLDQLKMLYALARSIRPERDGKLQHLKEVILDKRANPINPGNGKVLVFTAYADTATYLYENLRDWALNDLGIHIAMVSGGQGQNRTTFTPQKYRHQRNYDSILTNFAPIAKNRAAMNDAMPQEGEIDLLIATDCISEGQNLQDCDYVVNYDIHWNPVKLIQRFGRIDRIGSRNEWIKMVNFWPTDDLNRYIGLKERVESRMALVDIAATGEDNILNAESLRELIEDELTYRDKQLMRLKDEVLDLEDMDENISLSEFTLDDFRMDLLNYLEENREKLRSSPLGLFSVVPSPSSGKDEAGNPTLLEQIVKPGVIFCLKQSESSEKLEKVNPLQPFFLVYIRNDGTVRYNFVHAKQILSIFQSLCKGRTQPYAELCALFDEETHQGWDMSSYNELLKRALREIVQHFAKRDVAGLFKGRDGKLVGEGAPSADEDRFELITWLVIRKE